MSKEDQILRMLEELKSDMDTMKTDIASLMHTRGGE